MSQNAFMGFYFSPRGGSAQVARYLSRALSGGPWAPTLFTGSLGAAGETSNAADFFRGVRCAPLDYTPAALSWAAGGDPMATEVPMHASYEDKPGVPDRTFLHLDDAAYDRQVTSWARFLSEHTRVPPTVVHLHHLTPIHQAVHALWPRVPVVTHLHGTELKMLASVVDGTTLTGAAGVAHAWVARMRRWAAGSDRTVVVSAMDRELTLDLLPVAADRVVTIANGVDTGVFAPIDSPPGDRLARWRHWLVDDPQGWRPGGAAGSIRYQPDDLAAFLDPDGKPVPVVLFAGRFMRFKRLQLLIEAHHAMRSATGNRSVLVVVGGFPGEWEGEHPYETVCRLGADGVFFIGWRDHTDLADILRCSDVFAAPAVDEPFGLVYLEAMSAGIPPIATNTGGPLSFVNVDSSRPTGWLVPPDDVAATAEALAAAVSCPEERRVRGRRAAGFVRRQYSWRSAAQAFERLYEEVVDERAPTTGLQLDRPSRGAA
ncbi:MAG: glycosyltransferase family 4 protein [Ilumatobacteraceae bacterium]